MPPFTLCPAALDICWQTTKLMLAWTSLDHVYLGNVYPTDLLNAEPSP